MQRKTDFGDNIVDCKVSEDSDDESFYITSSDNCGIYSDDSDSMMSERVFFISVNIFIMNQNISINQFIFTIL